MESLSLLLVPAAIALCATPFLAPAKHLQRRQRLLLNLGLFALCLLLALGAPLLYAAEVGKNEALDLARAANAGWAYIAAALSTGIGSIGAGLAVAAAAPAAIGALAENENTFGKAMIFVGLGEGLAIFGLLVSILILQSV